MNNLSVPLFAGVLLFLSGAYLVYQSLFESKVQAHNVSWLQGSSGMLIGIIVAIVGVVVVVIGAAKYVREKNNAYRYSRYSRY